MENSNDDDFSVDKKMLLHNSTVRIDTTDYRGLIARSKLIAEKFKEILETAKK